jgi:hypothetical protein
MNYKILLIIIIIFIIFLLYKKSEKFIIATEACQIVASVYADVSGTSHFNNINVTGTSNFNNINITGISTLKAIRLPIHRFETMNDASDWFVKGMGGIFSPTTPIGTSYTSIIIIGDKTYKITMTSLTATTFIQEKFGPIADGIFTF